MLCSEADKPPPVSDCHSVEVSSRDSGWNIRNHLRGGTPENTVFSEPLMLLRSLFEPSKLCSSFPTSQPAFIVSCPRFIQAVTVGETGSQQTSRDSGSYSLSPTPCPYQCILSCRLESSVISVGAKLPATCRSLDCAHSCFL